MRDAPRTARGTARSGERSPRPRRRAATSSIAAASEIDAIAAVVQRLAVLLEAGVAPSNAWGYLLPDATDAPDADASGAHPDAAHVPAADDAPGAYPATDLAPGAYPATDLAPGVHSDSDADDDADDDADLDRVATRGARANRRRIRGATSRAQSRRRGRSSAAAAPSPGARVWSGGPVSRTARQAERRLAWVVRTVAEGVRLGVPADSAIEAASRATGARTAEAWLAVAAVWRVAFLSGAPIAPCLREVAATLREIAENQRAIEVALAAPVATARLMGALPVVALGFGTLLGFDSLRMLLTTVPGLVCLAAGLGLLALSRLWNARLIRVASARPTVTGLAAELTAVAMSGGVSVDRAQGLAHDSLAAYRLLEPRAAESVARVVHLSSRAGVPAAELLRSDAQQSRREARARGQKASAALSVRLMIPLGLCVLPAFMLLGVAPLLLAVLSTTLGSW